MYGHTLLLTERITKRAPSAHVKWLSASRIRARRSGLYTPNYVMRDMDRASAHKASSIAAFTDAGSGEETTKVVAGGGSLENNAGSVVTTQGE